MTRNKKLKRNQCKYEDIININYLDLNNMFIERKII